MHDYLKNFTYSSNKILRIYLKFTLKFWEKCIKSKNYDFMMSLNVLEGNNSKNYFKKNNRLRVQHYN